MISFSYLKNLNRGRYLLCLLLLFGCRLTATAQDRNVWFIEGRYLAFTLDFNQEPPIINSLTNQLKRAGGWTDNQSTASYSNLDGSLALHTFNDSLFMSYQVLNGAHQKLFRVQLSNRNIKKLSMPFGHFIFKLKNKFIILDLLTTMDIDSLNVKDTMLNRHLIETVLDEQFNVVSQKRTIYYSYPFSWATNQNAWQPVCSGHKTSDSTCIIISCNNDSLISYQYQLEQPLKLLDAVKVDFINTMQTEFNMPQLSIGQENNAYFCMVDKLSAWFQQNLGVFNQFNRITLNKQTGDMSNSTNLLTLSETYKDFVSDTQTHQLRYRIKDMALSPDGKLQYLLVWDWKSWRFDQQKKLMYLYKMANDTILEIVTLQQTNSHIRLGPNGKLYLFPWVNLSTYPPFSDSRYIEVIDNPNSPGKTVITRPAAYFLDPLSTGEKNGYGVISVPNPTESYKNASFTSTTACSQHTTTFTNTSDSIHWTRYRFYFGDGDSTDMDDDTRLSNGVWGVEHVFKNPGKYFVKMRAFTKEGGFVWFSDTITVRQSPVAKFILADTVGCQWIAYKVTNQSAVLNTGKTLRYHWNFGDDFDTTLQNKTPLGKIQLEHTYAQSGTFPISLAVSDGFCADTFSIQNTVNILAAPRPGITLSDTMGCTPFELSCSRTFTDLVDSIQWNFGDGSFSTATSSLPQNHLYTKPGSYKITQKLYGPTGCVTWAAAFLEVKPGFENGYVPELIRATIENKTVLVQWKKHPAAVLYNLYRNNILVQTTEDSFFTETYALPHATYFLKAVNVCKTESVVSNIGQLIHLTGTQQGNTVALVQWTPYSLWPQAVDKYIVESAVEGFGGVMGAFTTMATIGGDGVLQTTDPNYQQESAAQKCYRITAVSAANQNITSSSNTLCLAYSPIFFVPTAFSPNNDGLNDLFTPVALGIKNYTLKIYNRWGQMIYEGLSWNGKVDGVTAPLGSYAFVIEGRTAEDKILFRKGSVLLME